MNNKTIIIWLGIALVTAIAVLEVFDLHPGLTLGRYSISWRGLKHTGVASYDMVLTANGRPISQFSQYQCGPVLVMTKP